MPGLEVAATLAASCAAAGVCIALAARLGPDAPAGRAGEADVDLALVWALLGLTAIANAARAGGAITAGAGTVADFEPVARALVGTVYGATAAALVLALCTLSKAPPLFGRGLAAFACLGTALLEGAILAGRLPADAHLLVGLTILAPVGVAVAGVWSGRRNEGEARLAHRCRVAAPVFGAWILLAAALLAAGPRAPEYAESFVRLAAATAFAAWYPRGLMTREPKFTAAGFPLR